MEEIFHCKRNKMVTKTPTKLIIKIEVFPPNVNQSLTQRALLCPAGMLVGQVALLVWHSQAQEDGGCSQGWMKAEASLGGREKGAFQWRYLACCVQASISTQEMAK